MNTALTSLDDSEKAAQTIVLKDMGLVKGVEMQGPHGYATVSFVLPHSLVPRRATLRLLYQFDPSIAGHPAVLKIALNGTTISTMAPNDVSQAIEGFSEKDIAIPGEILLRNNVLTFEFNSGAMATPEKSRKPVALCSISPSTVLDVRGDKLPWENDLSQLPLPFFDSDLQTSTTVPIVFLSNPGPRVLEAAGSVALWLGMQAGAKPVRFTVSVGKVPAGNAIVMSASRTTLPVELQVPPGNGPLLALRHNPSDADSNVLVIAGNDDQQLLMAARTVALSRKATGDAKSTGQQLRGDTMQLAELALPAARDRDDAPKWMPLSKAAPLLACNAGQAASTDGSTPVPVYFHLRPDLFYGEKQTLPFHLHYRYNALSIAAGSALRIVLNGTLISEVPLMTGSGFLDLERQILLPVAALRPFGNTMLFNFDFIPARPDTGVSAPSEVLQGSVLCNTSLDTQGLASWAEMPNLQLFADAGYPFTRAADLSDTTVILPATPSVEEVSLYLHLVAYFGQQTGYPALRVTVEGPDAVIGDGRNYLVLGTVANQQVLNELDSLLPLTLDSNGVHVKPRNGYRSILADAEAKISQFWSKFTGAPTQEDMPTNTGGMPGALIEEIQSPASANHSVVIIALEDDASADMFASALLDRSHSGDISGSASLLRNGKFESYKMNASTYHVGNISWYARMRIWMTQNFLLMFVSVFLLSMLVGLWMRDWLRERARRRVALGEATGVLV